MAKLDLDAIFTYHGPFGTQQQRYVALRDFGKVFAHLIVDLTPASREQSLAITFLQQTVQMANAAIAIHEVQPVLPPVLVQEPAKDIDLGAEFDPLLY